VHTHRRALEAGCQLAGATVHFVTPELDHGPIVMQSAVPVLPGDDEHTLAARVLATEHLIYPRSVRWFVQGRLSLEGGVVRHERDPGRPGGGGVGQRRRRADDRRDDARDHDAASRHPQRTGNDPEQEREHGRSSAVRPRDGCGTSAATEIVR
jgi:hypothetical protein